MFNIDAVFWVLRVYMKFLSSIFYGNICFVMPDLIGHHNLKFVLHVADDLTVEEVDDALGA